MGKSPFVKIYYNEYNCLNTIPFMCFTPHIRFHSMKTGNANIEEIVCVLLVD